VSNSGGNTATAGTDPVFLLPARYEDRTRITPIGSLLAGTRVVVEGEVQIADVVFRRRRALLVRISDGSGFLNLRFFYFSGRSVKRGAVRRDWRWCTRSTGISARMPSRWMTG
jgi:RecG-like helicase